MSWQHGVQAFINFGVYFEDTWCVSELWEDDPTATHLKKKKEKGGVHAGYFSGVVQVRSFGFCMMITSIEFQRFRPVSVIMAELQRRSRLDGSEVCVSMFFLSSRVLQLKHVP